MELLPIFVFTAFGLVLLATIMFFIIGQITPTLYSVMPGVNVQNSISNVLQNTIETSTANLSAGFYVVFIGLTILIGIGEIAIAFKSPDWVAGLIGIAMLFVIPVIWITIKGYVDPTLITVFGSSANYIRLFDSVWFITAIELFMAIAAAINFKKPREQMVIYSEHPA